MTLNTVQEKIQASVAKAAWGKMTLPQDPFYCLMTARLILEDAFGWPDMGLYPRIMTRPKPKRAWYASDFEQAMRDRGYVAPAGSKPQVGDVLFGALPKPEGHVGIVFRGANGKLWVIENVMIQRPGAKRISGANAIVPLENWDNITAIGRFPASFLGGAPAPEAVVVPPTPAPVTPGPVVTPIAEQEERQVVLITGEGAQQDITGQRVEVSNITGVVINAKGDKIWIRTQ